MLLIAENYSS